MTRSTLALAAATLFAAGCSGILAPRPNLTRYYLLSPMAEGAATSERGSDVEFTVGLGPLQLPDYLNRTERAVRVGPNQMRFLENERWAEPLDVSVTRVLSQNLTGRLERIRVVTLPTILPVQCAYDVPLEILRFESTAKGDAELDARWSIKDGKTGKILITNETRFVEPAKGPGADAAITALNRALGRWSDEIASTLLRVSAAHGDAAPSGRGPQRSAH
jgi:uncharacterized protein